MSKYLNHRLANHYHRRFVFWKKWYTNGSFLRAGLKSALKNFSWFASSRHVWRLQQMFEICTNQGAQIIARYHATIGSLSLCSSFLPKIPISIKSPKYHLPTRTQPTSSKVKSTKFVLIRLSRSTFKTQWRRWPRHPWLNFSSLQIVWS